MNEIAKRFGKSRALLPVVHCCDTAQARKAVDVAMANGADGLWFINQGGMGWQPVLAYASGVRRAGVPWVGVNLLGLHREYALREAEGLAIDGIWTDNAGVVATNPSLTMANGDTWKRKAGRWGGLLFGGVAFKYQGPDPADQWGAVASLASKWVDVITTSGPATGSPAPVEKLAAMKAAIGDHPLAVASGVTPENVGGFLPYVDAYLVASGIESTFGVFDPGKVRALADQIHGWRA